MMVVRHTSPISYNIISLQGPCIHLPVIYFLFRDKTFHLNTSSANLQSALWFINDNDIMFIYPSSTPGTTHQNGIWWSCF